MPTVEFFLDPGSIPTVRVEGIGDLTPGQSLTGDVRKGVDACGFSVSAGFTDDQLRLLVSAALAHRSGHQTIDLGELAWLAWRDHTPRSAGTIIARCLVDRETRLVSAGWGPDGAIIQCGLHDGKARRSQGPYRWNPAFNILMDDDHARQLLALPHGVYPTVIERVRQLRPDELLAEANRHIVMGAENRAAMLYAAASSLTNESSESLFRREIEIGRARVLMQLGSSARSFTQAHKFFLKWKEKMARIDAVEAVHVQALTVRQQGDSLASIQLGRQVMNDVRHYSPAMRTAEWRRIWDYRLSLGVAYSHMAERQIARGRLFFLPGEVTPEWAMSKKILLRCLHDILGNADHPEAEHLTAHAYMRLTALVLQKRDISDDEAQVVASALAMRRALSIPGQAILDRTLLADGLLRRRDESAHAKLTLLREEGLVRGYAHQVELIDAILRKARHTGRIR